VLSHQVALACAVPTFVQPVVPSGLRHIWKPVSLLELSVQASRRVDEERTDALRPLGATGGAGRVEAVTLADHAESPSGVTVRTR